MSYIIEHPTRGVLVDQVSDNRYYANTRNRFSPLRPRGHGMLFATDSDVTFALSRIEPAIRAECVAMQYGSWDEVA